MGPLKKLLPDIFWDGRTSTQVDFAFMTANPIPQVGILAHKCFRQVFAIATSAQHCSKITSAETIH